MPVDRKEFEMKGTRRRFNEKRFGLAAVVFLVCGVGSTWAQSGDWLSPQMRPLFSRLQAMSHGVHSEAAWQELVSDVERQIDVSRRRGDVEQMIDAAVILSQIHSDMRGDHARALVGLEQTKTEAAARRPAGMFKLYVRMAEVYANQGNVTAIEDLITEFRSSPFYNPRSMDTSGGEQPGVAVRIPRPFASGDPSLTVSTMKQYERQARLAPGNPFPVIPAEGRDPNLMLLDPVHTKLLLVDFWLPGWTVWERDLSSLARLYRGYREEGLAVVGVPLVEVNPDAMDRYLAAGMTWPQLRLDRADRRLYGVTGDVTNFLVNQRGMIVGRDLRGNELETAILSVLRP
jgi:hypothetical protein